MQKQLSMAGVLVEVGGDVAWFEAAVMKPTVLKQQTGAHSRTLELCMT
jgi:hypothetical protein